MVDTIWWKIVTVFIMIYVIVAGFLIPLKPGIYTIDQSSAICGEELDISIYGYNSFYKSNDSSLEAWLKFNADYAIKATSIDVLSETNIHAKFSIPNALPNKVKSANATLLIHDEKDGASILPAAIFISDKNLQDAIDPLHSYTAIPYADIHTEDAIAFPFRSILYETIRNLFFHVSLWFSMMILLMLGLWNSIKVLRQKDFIVSDIKSANYTKVAIFFGLLGIITGSVWAKFTWGTFWTTDIKLNMASIAMLMYSAYVVLRNSIDDLDKRARVSAVYSVIAFVALIPMIFIIPRMMDSLHPGNGGNPALGGEDLDNTLRMVFYPAIIGMTMLGIWIANLKIRVDLLIIDDDDSPN